GSNSVPWRDVPSIRRFTTACAASGAPCVGSVSMTDPIPAPATFAPATGHTTDVEYAVTHRIGRVRLNRPRAVNSLTTAMCESMLVQLTQWAADETVGAVFIDGAGDKGLCAGGDVR